LPRSEELSRADLDAVLDDPAAYADRPGAVGAVAEILTAATTRPSVRELDGEAAAISMFVAERDVPPPAALGRGRRRRTALFAAAAAAAAMSGGAAAAATGDLPAPAQAAVADVLDRVGVSVPDDEDDGTPTGDTIPSTVATTGPPSGSSGAGSSRAGSSGGSSSAGGQGTGRGRVPGGGAPQLDDDASDAPPHGHQDAPPPSPGEGVDSPGNGNGPSQGNGPPGGVPPGQAEQDGDATGNGNGQAKGKHTP
jgi:hypothetical protein